MSLHVSVKYCCRFIFWCTDSVSLTKRASTQDLKEFKVPLQTCFRTYKDTLHYILLNMVEFQSFKNSGKTKQKTTFPPSLRNSLFTVFLLDCHLVRSTESMPALWVTLFSSRWRKSSCFMLLMNSQRTNNTKATPSPQGIFSLCPLFCPFCPLLIYFALIQKHLLHEQFYSVLCSSESTSQLKCNYQFNYVTWIWNSGLFWRAVEICVHVIMCLNGSYVCCVCQQ